IFDQYRRRGVLSMLYLDNIARYVEGGGALLIAAGPPFASVYSLHRTPLAAVLPARPTFDALNGVVAEGFRPAITDAGESHPVTAPLAEGGQADEWGRWFRIIEAAPVSGDALLEGPEGRPLLMLDRVGDGRVALLLSDQAWLWSRGVEGGGPYGELFRRLAHWLMKEPELEEERLTADIAEGLMRLERRTMSEAPETATVTTPSGAEIEVPLQPAGPGLFVGEAAIEETGLHRVRSDSLTGVSAAGPLNPLEFVEVLPSAEALRPFIDADDGGAYFIGSGARASLPDVRRTRAAGAQSGRDWLGLKRNEAYVARAFERTPLAPALAAVALVLALTTLAWAREGK
ncbi:MAG: hypothetical protein MI723_00660, partial [Caulobacterales bacterium]|nr:hypothetical protein [Caulobacterales bacterium]